MTPPPHSRIARYHGWITRHPVLVLVVAAVVGRRRRVRWPRRLQLKTAISELLAQRRPGCGRAHQDAAAASATCRCCSSASVRPIQAANVRYAKALTEKLHGLPPQVVALATYNIRDVRDFFERNKWLYVSESDLETIRDRLRSEISKRKNPLYVSLGEEESLDTLQKRVGRRARAWTNGSRTASSPATAASTSGSPPCRPGGLFVGTRRRGAAEGGAGADRRRSARRGTTPR